MMLQPWLKQMWASLSRGNRCSDRHCGYCPDANKLQNVIKSIELTHATVNKIKQNLAWALAYNVLAIPIAAGALLPRYDVLLSPVWAAVAMASSSLIGVKLAKILLLKNNSNWRHQKRSL
jgi:hypothetical protein